MNRFLQVAITATLCALISATAFAQAAPQTALDALTAGRYAVLDVEVPVDPSHPVRFYLGAESQEELALDVFAAESHDAAAERLAFVRESASRGLLDATTFDGLTDSSTAQDATLVAFVSGRYVVSIRRLRGDAPLAALAAHIQIALALVPHRGPARSSLRSPDVGISELAVPRSLVGSTVLASGSLTARRTSTGWQLERREGEYTLRLIGVDAHLNRVELQAASR